MKYDLPKLAIALVCAGLLLAPALFSYDFRAQTREKSCSEGWYITGYYVPREDELPGTSEGVYVERVGDFDFSQAFLNETRTEGCSAAD